MIDKKQIGFMIGNWVTYKTKKLDKNGDFIPAYAIIISLYRDNSLVLLDTDEKRKTIYASVDEISPIPITEEILKKNGFDATEAFGYFPEDIGYKLELTVFSRTEIWWTIADCEYKIQRIKYVHELQNILCVLKIEKDIVL